MNKGTNFQNCYVHFSIEYSSFFTINKGFWLRKLQITNWFNFIRFLFVFIIKMVSIELLRIEKKIVKRFPLHFKVSILIIR